MNKKKAFVYSFKYIFVLGISKGFNYIILLYFAVGIYSEQYITILVLLSLEQFLSLILPLNNSNIIYSKDILKYDVITNKLIATSLLILMIYLAGFLLFKSPIYAYFGIDNIVVFLSIFLSMIINSYLVYLTNYYKLAEEHSKALFIQALFLISFICIIVSAYFIDNKIIAFFLGKAIGLVIALIIIKVIKMNLTKYKFVILNISEFKKIGNLFSVSILGWISGLGFINVAKIYSTTDNLVSIGYILNLWNVFLLIGIGINSVYNPLIKKNISNRNTTRAIQIKFKTLFIYLLIALGSFLCYLIIDNTIIINFNSKVNSIFSAVPYTILLFIFSAFQYVVNPFYLTIDKFKVYNLINILAYSLWVLLIILFTYLGFKNYIWYLVLIYFIKGSFLYLYAINNLILNKSKPIK